MLLRSEVLHVNIGAQPWVVGEIPSVVVGIFVDHDLVAVPEPVRAPGQVKRGNAKSPAIKPETGRAASADVPHVAAAETAGETAMLKRMIEVETGIIASSVVPDPGTVVVYMRGLGMAFLVMKIRCRVGYGSMARGWTMLRNESAAYCVTAATVGTVLREGGQREHQGYSNRGQRNSKKFGE
jgi:hypothetical protein